MSKIEVLRNAIGKLDDAEEAMLDVRNAFSPYADNYKIIDSIFEQVGDAATTLRHMLSSFEEEELNKLMEQ